MATPADRLRLPATDAWLPHFCQASSVYSAMLLAEVVVVIATLSPGIATGSWWRALSTGTVLAQWIALSSVAVLCLLRPQLVKLPSGVALLTLASVLALMAFTMATLGFELDQDLGLGLTSAGQRDDRFVYGIVAIVLVVAALGLRYGYVHVQWRLQIESQARAEVAALTARIRPHFLFNSMNTIAGLVRVDADLAEQVIEDLADLFRAALSAGEKAHPLHREFELCERYLAIETLRLGERLVVEWAVNDAPMNLLIPPLLLQPLVENAVYHGIQPLPEGGRVRIAARVSATEFCLLIENPCPQDPQPRGGGHGMAQENVRQRLHYAYGARARLEVRQQPGYYGTTVHIPLAASRESSP